MTFWEPAVAAGINALILMNDFTAEDGQVREEMEAAVSRVLRSGWYVLGDENEAFCRNWAGACGVTHAVGLANGLDAIELSLRAAGIGQGDEVITTGMTAFATVLGIVRAGATPVLADIDPATGNLDIESAERCLTTRTRAIVLVHLYGQISPMGDWVAFCDRVGIALIEDCAQAHLARFENKVAGAFGLAGAYSFYPTKNLGAVGDAGALVTNDTSIAERVAILRNYGQSERYHHEAWGLNSRLDELQAALLSVRLSHLQRWTELRQSVAQRYHAEILSASVRPLGPPPNIENHVYHLFVIVSEQRDALQRHLAEAGIQTHSHYPIPVHLQPPCQDIRIDPNGLARTERHARTCLSLPCHPQLTDDQVSAVVEAVNGFAG